MRLERRRDFRQDRRIVDRLVGILYCSPSAIFTIVPRRIFPECASPAGSPSARGSSQRGHRADFDRDECDDLLLDHADIAIYARLEEHELGGTSSQLVVDAHHGTLGDIGMVDITSSIAPVEMRCPARMMMPSVGAITKT